MNKYKIGFSKISFIKNSPFNLVSIAFPELNIKEFEMCHVTNNYWKSYNNFLSVVEYYYNVVLNGINENEKYMYFQQVMMKELMFKLLCAKQKYYNNKSWNDILNDLNINCNIPIEKNTAYDGVKLNSNEELQIYEYVHNIIGIKTFKSIGYNRNKKYCFAVDDKKYNKFYPDFIIEKINKFKLEKPIIIEYYGMFNLICKSEFIREYITKTNRKNEYYKSNPDIYFIDIYPCDLKNNFEGVRNKLTSFFMDNFNVDINKFKGGVK
jgi:hypothetical protein